MTISPAQALARAPDDEREAFIASLTDDEIDGLLRSWQFHARPEQRQPVVDPTDPARWWAAVTGRGWGKTRAGAEWVLDRCEAFAAHNWPHLVALLNKTFDDVRSVQIGGESGLAACAERRGYRLDHAPTSLHAELSIPLPDGGWHVTQIELHTSVKPDRIRGRNIHTLWGDELAAWDHKVDSIGNTAFTNADFSLRAECPPGLQPMGMISTTPKPIKQVRDLVGGKMGGRTVVTHGSLYDNVANLASGFVQAIVQRYAQTRLGAQEIEGALLDAVEGALWRPDKIDDTRVIWPKQRRPRLGRIVVGVDPSGSDESGDTCGIVVVGISADADDLDQRHVYVLEDASCELRPEVWGRKVVEVFRKWGADRVVAEVNFGAALVVDLLHLLDPMMPVHEVRASRGKTARAEPAALVYDQGRAHHCAYFGELEVQMLTWDPRVDNYSPDRMDALVWAIADLLPEVAAPPPRQTPSTEETVGRLPTGAAAARRRAA